MRLLVAIGVLTFALASAGPRFVEAPTGFDNASNGMVDDVTHQADQAKFDNVETIKDGLGPLYNAQSCRECHQDPTSGGASQITELRAGHRGPDGRFRNAEIPIARGTEVITGRSLVNDRAICPSGAFPDTEIHERVPDTETIRTNRISLNLLGDGFVEMVADQTLIDLAITSARTPETRSAAKCFTSPLWKLPARRESAGSVGKTSKLACSRFPATPT